MNNKPIVLTGLRANNALHIGNYFGAMLPMVDMANQKSGDYQVNFFVPDLHSFTTPIDHGQLYEKIIDTLQMYVATGLPLGQDDIYIYRQSAIPAHSEMAWILSCFTYFGEMNRMTQFKDKSQGLDGESVSVGLFNYPILMAADILLYGAEYVPVGDDQAQHLEFTRDIAERMNHKFGGLFKQPHSVKQQHKFFGKDQGLRIRDLADPTKKMSKSNDSSKGIIFLTDKPDEAAKKVKSASTDSYGDIQHDYTQRPGISNLLDILKLLGGDPDQYIGQHQYGPLKEEVAKRLLDLLSDFQSRYEEVDIESMKQKLAVSEEAVEKVALNQLDIVQRAIGLRPKR